MNTGERIKTLAESAFPGMRILENEPMSRHTSFCIGGPADVMAFVRGEQELSGLLTLCRQAEVPVFLMGNGSNLLVSDKGIRGLVIKTCQMSDIRLNGEQYIEAECGALLSKVAVFAKEHGLSGLEFSYGIPGSLGGAVYMNAGAYGGQMQDVVESSDYFDCSGERHTLSAQAHAFSYRTSFFAQNKGACHIRTRLHLQSGNQTDIARRMQELKDKRVSSQPLNMPSAGSVFKRPQGYYAGTLIEQAGLKGCSVGGAQVSVKHAGFIVNTGGATCCDVLALIEHIRQTVFSASGVELEPEVCAVGER